ncbi:uncharacterized protein FIESC28_09110 [Fusarium coffeatum]|uniref:Condensation domain-containing protein n=1 Tax=Fusarium coffeatum TaxID=231269 RepID=A0A366R4F8_9HYPO|nr:uncharacterized protein FIESC28_09110 [Fusarium coffeatum]RBR11226.1 hypothetical protein FIESC28_09110 [Fusarium coffeatum]
MGSISPNPTTARLDPAFTTLASNPDVRARPFSTVEKLLYHFKTATAPLAKEHLSIYTALKLSFPSSVADPVPHIRTAWAATAKHHPQLGSVLNLQNHSHKSGKTPAILIPTYDAEEWLGKAFRVDHKATNATALFELAKDEEYATCTWIPFSSQVLFQTSHWRMDGGSAMTIAVNFLHVVSQSLAKGTDAALDSFTSPVGDGSIAPNVDWILDAFSDEASTPDYMRKAADAMYTDMLAGAPSVALPPREGSGDAIPGDSTRATLSFGKETTSRLLAGSKAKGLTISLATHAAIIRCSARYPQHPLCKSYGRFAPVDIRKNFPSPYNTPQYSIGEYCAAFPVIVLDVVNENKTFNQVCQELQKSYGRARNSGFKDDAGQPVSTADLGAPFIRRILDLVNTPPPPDMPTVQAVDFASMGLVEKVLDRTYPISGGQSEGEVVVEDFWLGTQMIAKAVQCHGWTFRDQFVLTASWNKSYYDRDFIERFLGEVKEEMIRGLEV